MLSNPEKAEFDHPTSILYYSVEDIEASYAEFVERGVSFEGEPSIAHRTREYELWLARLRDTEENPLVLMEQRPVVAASD